MPPVSPRNYYGFANHDYTDHETTIGTFRIEHRFNNDLSRAQHAALANYKRQVEATIATLRATDINGAPLTPATPLSALVVTRNHDGGRTRDNDDDAFINQTELVSKFGAWGMRHTLLARTRTRQGGAPPLELRARRQSQPAGVQAADVDHLVPEPGSVHAAVVHQDAERARHVPRRTPSRSTCRTSSTSRRRGRPCSASAGKTTTPRRAPRAPDRGALTTGPFGRKDEMLSGRAGLIWQPSARQSYYVAIGNSYNPSGELGVYGGTGTNLSDINAGPRSGGEPQLRARRAVGLRRRIAAARVVVPHREDQRADAPIRCSARPILAGKRRVDGLELQLTGRITPEWDVYSGLAFMDGEIVTGPATVQGKVPLGVPDVSGLAVDRVSPAAGWEVGGGLRYSSGFWLNDANTGEVPSYTAGTRPWPTSRRSTRCG